MKLNCAALFLMLFSAGCATRSAAPQSSSGVPRQFSGATPLEWSQRLADSEMARRGDSLVWKPGGKAKWDYAAGLFTLSLLKLNAALGQETDKIPGADALKSSSSSSSLRASANAMADDGGSPPHGGGYVEFAKAAIGSYLSEGGAIQTYNRNEFQLDSLNPGKTALALWRLTHESRYRGAAYILHFQLASQPRTYDGGFWHKQRYTNQMWLDGIYMAAPFYVECGRLFDEAGDLNDAVTQIRLMNWHTYDADTGLNYHGWDADRIQPWANPVTGCSSNFWGRAEGWYAMALVDVLDFLPVNHPARSQVIAIFQKTARGIMRWQDAQTGLWWQVMDQGDRQGNYREATASAMFVYALAKGVNHGYLSRDYIPAVEKGYAGILQNFLQPDGENRWSLTHCCSVAGLGGLNSNGKIRDGSFQYYVHEPIVANDLKGVGPFIQAGLEMETLSGSPSKM
jgi:unsaturated rhamnogalacturonyl hydrolase